jgi:AraC family transcriptional regulator
MISQAKVRQLQPATQAHAPLAHAPLAHDDFRVMLRSDEAGVMRVPALPHAYVAIHAGPSVHVACQRGGYRHAGRAVYGDIDIIPAQTPSVWEMKGKDTALLMRLSSSLLRRAAKELDLDSQRLELRNRFQMRDPAIESIGWALKAEMESGFPSGRLYIDGLAMSLAARLVRCYSSAALPERSTNGRIVGARLRRVLAYIEDNLAHDLSLSQIAAVAELSISHFKASFREAVGQPVHQYVIRRRVERAKKLLAEGSLSISQVALDAGFSHQSHLARHLRRIAGFSPRAFRHRHGA